jgi:hypothetical protein
LVDDDTVRTLPDVVDLTTFVEITPDVQERPSREVYDSSVDPHIDDAANTWSISLLQPPLGGCDVCNKPHAVRGLADWLSPGSRFA